MAMRRAKQFTPKPGADHVPPHPGYVLYVNYMKPAKVTAYKLAKHLGVNRSTVERFSRSQIGCTPDLAMRLGMAFRPPPEHWLSLQNAYDTHLLRGTMHAELAAIQPIKEPT